MKEDRQPLRKRIQDNDNEDDPGSQGEKKLEKMKEMFTKYLEELRASKREYIRNQERDK